MGLLLPLMVGIGLAEVVELPQEIVRYLITVASALLLAAVVVGLLHLRQRNVVRERFFIVLMAGLMLTVGIISDLLQQKATLVEWQRGVGVWHGVVAEPPHATAKTWRFTALVDVGEGHRKVMLAVMKDALAQKLRVGDAIEFESEIRKPYNYIPKGTDSTRTGFDYAKWLERQGYSGQAFVPNSIRKLSKVERDAMIKAQSLWNRLRIATFTLRDRLLARYKGLNLDADGSAVLAAITLGDKSRLTTDIREKFSASGASHVLALSGLHLSILVAFLLTLLRPLRLRRWSQWLMVGIVLALIWSFVLLSGCSISIVRSALMLSLMLILGLRGEGWLSLSGIALAAFLILCFSPRSLVDVSFQLSFLAVFFIVYFQPYFQQDILMRCPRWSWPFLNFLYVSVIAQIATAPLVACVFGRLPLLFLPTNMIVIPCAYLILIGALCFFALMWCQTAAQIVGVALAWVVRTMNCGLEWIASCPFASVSVSVAPPTALMITLLVFPLFAWLRFRSRAYFYWSALLLGLAITFQIHR